MKERIAAISAAQWNGIILVLLALTWGSSFILMKEGLKSFTYIEVACMRIVLSAISLLPLFFLALRKIQKSDWGYIWLAGITGSGLPPFLFTYAQQYIDSTVAGILNSTTPFFTLIIAFFILKQEVQWKKWIGITIGFLGTVLIVVATRLHSIQAEIETHSLSEAFDILSSQGIISKGDAIYTLLILLATFCYAISVNVVKVKLQTVNSLIITPVSFFLNAVPAALIFLLTSQIEVAQFTTETWQSFGAICILAVLGTAVASILYYRLTQRTNAMYASMVTYLMPIVSIFWGFRDNEAIGVLHLIGMLVILSGVYLVTRPSQS